MITLLEGQFIKPFSILGVIIDGTLQFRELLLNLTNLEDHTIYGIQVFKMETQIHKFTTMLNLSRFWVLFQFDKFLLLSSMTIQTDMFLLLKLEWAKFPAASQL